MTSPDIQYFASSGTWAKPPGAVRVDIVLQGGQAGVIPGAAMPTTGPPGAFTAAHLGYQISPVGAVVFNGDPGKITASSFDASDLPETVKVTVGKGGRPGGRDGYALIVTHLAPPSLPSVPPHDLMLHAHSHDRPDDGQPHEHLHTGPGHTGLEHAHPHRHAPGEQR